MNRKRRCREAFTLLELMIVLVILVLIIAAVGPRLLGTQKKGEINVTKIQIANFEDALKTYHVEMRSFPSTEDGLQALLEPPSDERAARKWAGPYLDEEIPLDPWGNEYQYEYPPTHNQRDFPDIWSYGPDGEPDTDDDIVNWSQSSGEQGDEEGLGDDTSFDNVPSSRSSDTRSLD